MPFTIDDKNPDDQYARLYAAPRRRCDQRASHLPRYGLGNYIAPTPDEPPTQAEAKVICRTSAAPASG